MIALRPGDGIDPADIEPGPRPAIIAEGESWRAYGSGIYVRSVELWGSLAICQAVIRSSDAAADRVNEANRE